MPISNPASVFVTGSDRENFEYEGGSTLYHFSPRDNELSKYLDMNIVFFADSEEHGLNVLRRMLVFHIDCAQKYHEHEEKRRQKYGGRAHDNYFYAQMIDTATEYIFAIDNGNVSLELAPTNQVYKVGWASNDTLME